MEVRKDALYDIKIESPKGNLLDLSGVNYATAIDAVQSIKENCNDEKLIEIIESVSLTFGFSGQSEGKYSVNIFAKLPTILTGKKQTCGRRNSEVGPWGHGKDLDEWKLIGKDEVCSFCGSLSPNSVLKIVKEFGTDVIEIAKSYKWYVKRPEVPNSSFGGIKYYRQHDTQEFLGELKKLLPSPK